MNDHNHPSKPVRTAVTYRVCQGWRTPIFQRLASHPMIDLKVFHGQDINNTKLINAKDFGSLNHQQLKTYSLKVNSTGRNVPCLIYPSINKYLDQYQPDVLLCEGGSNIFNNLLIYRWAKKHHVPTIWWGLGEIPGRKYRGVSKLYRYIRRRLMRESTVLLGYSTRATNYFKQEGLTQPIFKAVNCVDTDRVMQRIHEAKEIQPSLRERMNLTNRKIILFVGAVEPPKRLEILLNAYHQLQVNYDNLALLIVGDGSALPALKHQAEELDLKNVYFTGRIIENVSEYFLAADIFVLPGLGGLAISEAMAHSLPVLCTTADGCEVDLVMNGINGFILPEGDTIALVDTISNLLSDPQQCKAMGNASYEIIEKQHNVNTYVQGIVDAILCAYQNRT